jgi:hypothetical protein
LQFRELQGDVEFVEFDRHESSILRKSEELRF